MNTPAGSIRRHFRRPTVIEVMAIAAVVVVLIAFIVPGAWWAASGTIRLPVRVIVFDARLDTPISGAHVAIFNGPPLLDLKSLQTERGKYDSRRRARDGDTGKTNANGIIVIDYEFRTGANHERPQMHTHLDWAWVHVQADGYGGVVVPVRHESSPTQTVREPIELVVPVGLIRADGGGK